MAASLPSLPQLWPSVLPFPLPLPAYESQSSSPDDHLRFQGALHETESEDDDADDYNDNDNDYAGGLARRIAHSMLDDEIEENTVVDLALDYPTISIAASPQSTLYNISSSQYGVSEASSKASSGAPSSPSAMAEFPLQENDWDLLNTAAGEVARLRSQKTNETFNLSNPSLFHPSHNIDDLKDRQEKNWHFDINQYKDHSYLKDAMNCQEPQWKRWSNIEDEPKVDNRQFLLQASQGRAYNSSKKETDSYRHSPVGFYNRSWPEMGGAIAGSGMRALFLTANNRGSGGTGVFLPRHYGSSYDNSKKKPSFSTVLLPSKVVHALNLQLDDSPPPQQLKTSAWPSLVSPSNKVVLPQSPLPSSRSYASVAAKGNNQIQTLTKPVSTLQQITADISLPTEWTY